MNILYVVSRPLEINTSASIRNRATIEGLIKLGHKVDLITTAFDNNHCNFDKSISKIDINIKYIEIGGIQKVAKFGRRYRVFNPIKNIIHYLIDNLEIYDNLKGITKYVNEININDKKYDLIISSSDPKSSHLFVNNLYEKNLIKNTPWIQIWGDPFLNDITIKNKYLNKKIKREEERLLKYAREVIYVSELTLENQKDIYPKYKDKMRYVPVPYIKKEMYEIKEMEKDKNITFLYCGDYSSKIRNIKPLYDAINNSKHRLIICGDTDLKLEETKNVSIYKRVSYEKVREFENQADVLVHLSNLSGFQIPGKIYSYSRTNKLILFILDGDTNLIKNSFEKYKRYIFVRNNKDISSVIKEIENNKYFKTQFIVDEFYCENVAKEIIKI